MDRLAELFEKRLQKIDQLNDFITIFGKRSELVNQLKDADTLTDENRQLLALCRQHVASFRAELLPESKRIQQRAECLQSTMLNMIETLDQRDHDQLLASAAKENRNPSLQQQRTPEPNNGGAGGSFQVPSSSTRLLLSDYKNSPFARTIKPAALQFVDFELERLADSDFRRIPQYMRGRETLAELQQFLDAVIVRCFTDKYTLLHKKRECVRNPQQLAMWKHFVTQASYFPHRMFITQGDIANLTGRLVDKKTANRIAMLRHLQIVQEQRHQSTVCYLWLGQ